MTHEEDLRRLLHDAGGQIPAGHAPVEELVREGRHWKKRRGILQAASVAAAVAVVAVGAFVVQPSIGGSGNLTAQPTTSPSGRAAPTEADLLGQWRALGKLSQRLESVGFPYKSSVLEFRQRDGQFSWAGNDECNRWSGRFKVSAHGGFSTFQTISTAVGCPYPFAVVTVPEVVTKATQVRLVDGQLRLFDEEGSLLATFVRVSSDTSGVEPDNSGQGAVVLTCPSELRGVSVWEATGPVRETPQELSSAFVNPSAGEQAVVASIEGDSATAYILRRNGTARAELALFRDARGWRLGTSETCADERVRLRQPMDTRTPGSQRTTGATGSTPIPLSTSSWRPGDPRMEAGIWGRIAVSKDGCVYFKTGDFRSDVIWPARYSADLSADGVLTVRNPSGEAVGHEGTRIDTGGGGFSEDEGGVPDSLLRLLVCEAADNSVLVIQDTLPPL